MPLHETYIVDGIRTPIGRYGGALSGVRADDLGAIPLKALLARHPQLDPALVEDVYLGCANQAGEDNRNVARMSLLLAGLPVSVPGSTLNRLCGSGLDAIGTVARGIAAGELGLAIAGGVESMSRVPMGADGGAWAQDPQVASKTYFIMQGISADLLSSLRGHSRSDVDAYSAESHRRAHQAWTEGRFDRSVVPVQDFLGQTLLSRDETIRPETSSASLAALKPAFTEMGEKYGYDSVAMQRYPQVEKIEHIHHAGNSSGIVDGAAAVLVGNAAVGARLGLKPRARIVSFAAVGSEPTLMLDGPAPAARKALAMAGMQASDIDLWELNEAFASVVLTMMEELSIPHDRINVNGGAIAMGHPLGATGAMILGTVLDELERTGKQTALVSLCVAAGMGSAMVIQRV